MSESIPLKPTGDSCEAIFAIKTHDANFGPSRRIRSSRTVKVRHTSKGIFLKAKRNRGGASSGGGMNYKGTYDSTKPYNQFDVVRQMAGDSQGVWICVVSNQTAGQDPVWPEPASTGGDNIWELLAFGVQATSVCESGVTQTVYFNATPPS